MDIDELKAIVRIEPDTFATSTPELAACAEINFKNVAKMNQSVAENPIFQLALEQLRSVVVRLEGD